MAVDRGLRVAVVGATGAVGLEMLRVLEERCFPSDSVRVFASDRREERRLRFRASDLVVEPLAAEGLAGLDIALFATSADVSRRFVPEVVARDGIAIDNSRAYRMDADVPLVVPEVNAHALVGHSGIIANPNCSTIQMVQVLRPLAELAGLRRIVAATYQSGSGTGLAAIEELRDQSAAVLSGRNAELRVYRKQIAFNCIPQIDVFDNAGDTREELKMIGETRKIMDLPSLPIAVTCVRVPVFRSHAIALNVETKQELAPDEARALLSNEDGIRVLDDPSEDAYPTQAETARTDETWVGRIRRDDSTEHGLWLWVVSDNLRKGAALNAVQIAEQLTDADAR
ncbi:aspartate-semialdehyde dehydrogenase [bacterium]|nr:aspartate-semialdehyde dehydrogenase [bacterium]